MKVAIVNKFYDAGGAAIAAKRLFHALQNHQKQLDCSYIIQNADYNQTNAVPHLHGKIGNFQSLGLLAYEKFKFLFHEKNKDIRFQFSLANSGVSLHKNKNIKKTDIIHLHWFNQGFLSLKGLLRLSELKKPIVWTQHDIWGFTGGCHYSGECKKYLNECSFCPFLKNPKPNDISNKIFNKKITIYSKLDLTIISPSHWMARKVSESSLFKNYKQAVIPNTINVESFRPIKKYNAQEMMGLNPSKYYILFGAAKLSDKRKGFSFLVEALVYLHQNKPELTQKIELLVFGSELPNLNLPYKINYLGYLNSESDIIKTYQAGNIFLLPSLEDNLPNTVMESLACGTPVVAFNNGGITDMVEHKINGYLAESKSAKEMAEGIFWILFKNNYEQLCNSARKKVLQDFSPEIVSLQHKKLYSSLLNTNG